MNFFERKERYKSGQNPIPTQEEFEKHMVNVGDKWWPIAVDFGKEIILGSSIVKRDQIKQSINKMLPKLTDDEVDELYSLLMKCAVRIKEDSE